MKVVSTEALTKLIQLVKSAFIKVDDVVEVTEIETETPSEITLATVATSGDYDDLINKPTIPAAVTEATVSGWGFTKNTGTVTSVNNVSPVNGNVTLSIPTVPTNVSAFTNDAGYITSSALNPYVLSADLATVATSGSYNDLSNKPDLNSKANIDLSNVTSAGKNIANWSTNVTNCITEIPQDIKLELNNGTLTLKAGSKVYVPNGAGVFDEVIIESDKTVETFGITGSVFVFIRQDGSIVYGNQLVSTVNSGTTPGNGLYYKTDTNEINTYNSGVLQDGKFSLPIAICTVNSGTVTSIDQVFNGFGYIGSTVFALPGVKGLIPNGRNEDGSLKNIEFITDEVVTRTITWNNAAGQDLFIGKYTIDGDIQFISTGRIGQYYQQEDEPSLIQYAMWYKPSENKMYRCDNSDGNLIWKNCFPCYLGQWFTSGTSPYPITELTTKLSFRAADYDDVVLKQDLATDLNGKADTDLSNINTNGKSFVSGLGMPSSRYIDLTLGASNSNYTAPANGYFCIIALGNNSRNHWIEMRNDSASLFARGVYGSVAWQYKIAIEAKKSDIVNIMYEGINTPDVFRFIYAEGEN